MTTALLSLLLMLPHALLSPCSFFSSLTHMSCNEEREKVALKQLLGAIWQHVVKSQLLLQV